jgi:hypothetical protein
MKKYLLLLVLLLACISMANGQIKVTTSTGLFEEPSLTSKRITTIMEGEAVTLGEKKGEFWFASFKKHSGYIHESCLSNFSGNKTGEPSQVKVIPLPPATTKLDSIDYSQYGGIFSAGIALGGGGLIGVPIRLFPSRNFALELGAYARGLIATEVFVGLNINGGLNVYFRDSFNPKRKKIRHDGAFFRGGKTFFGADIKDIIIMGGWTRDIFKPGTTGKVFTLELGAGYNSSKITTTESGSWGYRTTTYTGSTPMLFWKFAWSIFPTGKMK